jgi:hypothetical protein
MDLATAKRMVQQGRLRELLQVPPNAQGKELEKACRSARVRHHPDKGGSHELAAIINATADELLQGLCESAGNPAYASEPTYSRRPDYTSMLRKECQILEGCLKQVEACVKECGYGDHRPPCNGTRDCQCMGDNAQRIRDELTSLYVMIDWAENAANEANDASGSEELWMLYRLRQALEKARDLACMCESRVKLFNTLAARHCQNLQRQAEQAWREVSTDSDSSDSDSSDSDTPTLPEQPPQDRGTGPRAEEHGDQEVSDKGPRVEEHGGQEVPEETQGHTSSASYFPRASVWLQKREPEKAVELKHLWRLHTKVIDARRKRVLNEKPTSDLDEKADTLMKKAWELRRSCK